jgi:hypothetical protein
MTVQHSLELLFVLSLWLWNGNRVLRFVTVCSVLQKAIQKPPPKSYPKTTSKKLSKHHLLQKAIETPSPKSNPKTASKKHHQQLYRNRLLQENCPKKNCPKKNTPPKPSKKQKNYVSEQKKRENTNNQTPWYSSVKPNKKKKYKPMPNATPLPFFCLPPRL